MRALVFLFLLLIFPAALAAAPTIDALTIIDPVSLNPDSTVIVICNSTFSDEDGYANVTSVNATFWDATSSSEEASDDENDHYTNSSCSIGTNTSNISAPVTCTFEVEYYANAAAWTCKINVFDDASSASNQTDTTVDTLLALSIPDSVNFGEMDRGGISTDLSENVTTVQNAGNVQIDVNLSGDAMGCTVGVVPVGNIKYSDIDDTAYNSMTALTGDTINLDLNVTQQTGAITTKDIFWKIKIPDTGVGGSCTNTITFTAVAG